MKRFFKLLTISISLALALVLLTACSQGAVTTLGGSYFLKKENVGNVSIIGNVNETNVYNVTFERATNSNAKDVKISLADEDGYNVYVTKLTNTTYGDTDCYLFETELKTKITYALYDEAPVTYDNYTKSKVYFLSVSNKLKPMYSETTALANSPVRNDDGKYSVTELEYKYTVTYGDVATVNFTPIKGDFGIPTGDREYKKYDKSTYYFDNASMLFMPRAIKLNDSSSLSFSSIDALSGINRSMKMTADSSTPSEDVIFSLTEEKDGVIKGAYYVDGVKVLPSSETGNQVIPCQVVNFAVSGTFSGSPIKCWYAKTSLDDVRANLIKMQTTAPYSLGTFTYVISKTTNG